MVWFIWVLHIEPSKKSSYKDQRELGVLPEKIETFENEVERLQNLMADDEFYKQEIIKVQAQLEKSQKELAHRYVRWEALE
ncbi:hypothetical protein MNBD_GAMMA06-322 [hydrothermal vent metagenome]|uniref:ABC transporter Uup C-terminal domain-containing protein n=1 Tax=hydrothermal vent metagenome TaxID=652676 RepID=A0A3B0WQN3_9ZZZZ